MISYKLDHNNKSRMQLQQPENSPVQVMLPPAKCVSLLPLSMNHQNETSEVKKV